jgi:hypothetical protein
VHELSIYSIREGYRGGVDKKCLDVAIVEMILLKTELANIVERPTVKHIGHNTSLKREATND